MNLSLNAFLIEEMLQDTRVTGGNLLAIKPFYTLIVDFLGDGE